MERILFSEAEIARMLKRLESEIEERRGDAQQLVFIGIQRRGVHLAKRLYKSFSQKQENVALGELDITFYRDDWSTLSVQPQISASNISCDISNASVILVDDVLYSGRTIRAALEALSDFGRPKRIELLVLIDRGHRELPIQADYVGRAVPTAKKEHINVYIQEQDG